MLPTVDFCGLQVTRLIMGANPFGGFSHQNPARDQEMRAYYTPERIVDAWEQAWKAGINTMIANNETPHVLQTTAEYLAGGGPLQWIAQVNCSEALDMRSAIDQAVEIGCKAAYLQGGLVDHLYAQRDARTLCEYVRHGQSCGIPIGVAGHSPAVHDWVSTLDVVDFYAVCFFNCGHLRPGPPEQFCLEDMFEAVQCIQRLEKPCIGYKIMGAGRIDPQMAFEFAFSHIKPMDVVNVGMYLGDKEDMVRENVALVRGLLGI